MVAGRRRGLRAVEPVRLPEPDEREAYRTLDFALRAAEILLSSGAAASDVMATTVALANACGLRRVISEVTFTSITLTYVRAPDVAPVTSIRLVHKRTADYARVTEVHNLVDDLVDGRITPAAAMTRLDVINARRHPYRGWMVTGFRALLATAIAVLMGGGAIVATLAFVTTVVIDQAAVRLSARRLPAFYANALGAAVATAVAMLVRAADLGVRPSLLVASGIVLLLPGVALVGAVQDAINGFPLTAAARTFEVFVLTAGIVSGVAAVLSIAGRAGVALVVNDPPVLGLYDLPVQACAAAIAAAAAAGADHSPRYTLPLAALAGLLGWGVFRGFTELGFGPTLCTGAAAVVVGIGASLCAERQSAPPLIYIAAGIIPLLPGLPIYRGMLFLAEGNTSGGLLLLSQATGTGLALAAGVILGEFLVQSLFLGGRGIGRLRVARLAGPLHARRRV